MTNPRGIVLLAVLWFLVLAGLILMATERAAHEDSTLLWRARRLPQKEATLQSLRLFLPALLRGQQLTPGAPRWALRHAAAFAQASRLGRGSITVTVGSKPLTLVIRDTAGFLAPGWQPQLLPALAHTLAGRHGDYPAILRQLQARYRGGMTHTTDTMPAVVAWRLAAITTRHPVYGGRININSVPASVLHLLDIPDTRIRAFLQDRMRRQQPYTQRNLASAMAILGFTDMNLFGTQRSGVYRVVIGKHGSPGPVSRDLVVHVGVAGASPVPQERPMMDSLGPG